MWRNNEFPNTDHNIYAQRLTCDMYNKVAGDMENHNLFNLFGDGLENGANKMKSTVGGEFVSLPGSKRTERPVYRRKRSCPSVAGLHPPDLPDQR